MHHVDNFARVVEVRITSNTDEFDRLLKEGWVELGVLLIPHAMASLIPTMERPYLGYTVALGRLQDEPRAPSTEETFQEPDPDKINAKLTEGWTLVGIGTTTSSAFTQHRGRGFASFFIIVQK